jgi:hypothetical protein
MFFALITFLAAFLIEGIGTVVSVIGLSTLFGANPIIIVLAVALDVGKLVVVTLLYKHWRRLGYTMRAYGLIAAMVTMTITSAGAGGYLSGEFQKAVMGVQEGSLKVDVLKGQIAKYEERKKQIDNQIAAIPEKYSATQRIRLMNQFKAEQQDLQVKIGEIDKQLPDLQIKQIGVEAKAGPILYIAKAFNITIEEAVKWVILMIIIVFDPLAVFLIIAGNFLWDQRSESKKDDELDAELAKFKPEVHGGEFPRLTDQEFEQRTAKVQEAVETYDDFTLAEPPREETPVPDIVPPSPVADPVHRAAGPDPEPEVSIEELNAVTARLNAEAAARRGAIRAAIEAAAPVPEVVPVAVTEPAPKPADPPAPEVHPALLAVVNENGVLVPPAPPAKEAATFEAPLTFRTPSGQQPLVALETANDEPPAPPVNKREQITLSSLGLVKPDPDTIVDAAANQSGLTR